jgi:hypothetical protein
VVETVPAVLLDYWPLSPHCHDLRRQLAIQIQYWAIEKYFECRCIGVDHQREENPHRSTVHCVGVVAKIVVYTSDDDGYDSVANDTRHRRHVVIPESLESSLDAQIDLCPDGDVVGQGLITSTWLVSVAGFGCLATLL